MSQTPLSGPELAAAMKIGTRVVRGDNWKWHNEDGPPPGEGTVTEELNKDGFILVRWDTGSIFTYRMGYKGKYDLKIADSLPVQQQNSFSDSVEQNDNAVTVKCSYCKEAFVPECLSSHELKCLDKPIRCPTCSAVVALREWFDHECQTARIKDNTVTVKCSHCEEAFVADCLPSHEQQCLDKPIRCPSPTCRAVVALREGFDHECQTMRIKATEKLVEDLADIIQKEELSDITIKVKDKEFKLHRIILAGRNPYFNSMFKTEMKEKTTGIVSIDDCDPDIFNSFIYFVYTGKTRELSGENVCALYEVADKYQEDQLKAECLCFMKNKISVDSCCDFLVLALRYDEKELLKCATEFFCRNTKEIIQSVKWQIFLKQYTTQANELYIKSFDVNAK